VPDGVADWAIDVTAQLSRVGSMANLVERVGELIASALGTRVNYGEPVTIDGAEMVPVSVVTFGFGGGSDEEDEESGGGGGGMSIPVGAYVGGFDGPRFVPNPIPLMVVSIPLVYVTGSALSKIVRALKK
jgi:hypothetical protein